MNKVNYEEILKYILEKCKVNGMAIRICDFKKFNITTDIKTLNLYFKNETVYVNYQNFCRQNGYHFDKDFNINGEYKPSMDLTLSDYTYLVIKYNEKFKKFPTQDTFLYENGLPSSSAFYKMIKDNNITQSDFNVLVGSNVIRPNDFTYEHWLDKLINKCNEDGEAPKWEDITEYGFPSPIWLLKHCKNTKVTNFNEFVEYELNMVPRYDLSKEKASKMIIDMQNKLDRPMMKKDLKSLSNGGVGVSLVLKYWKSFYEMKLDLGLETIERDKKNSKKSLINVKRDIARICVFVYEHEKRDIITQKDWKLIEDTISYPTCCRLLLEVGMTIREYISLIGFHYIEAGTGLNYDFEDKEHVKSRFEMTFSRFLKDKLKLICEKDYQKEVRYSTFIKDYKGLIDCDYVINYNNEIIYIEIAGILQDFKINYVNNIPIDCSKSKEKYRQKLMVKEKLFKDNNLSYYILFPCDLHEDFLLSIFN